MSYGLYTITWPVREKEKHKMSWNTGLNTYSVQIFSHFLICKIEVISTFQECGKLNAI